MAQQPIYSAEEEQKIMAMLWSPAIAKDPEAFVRFVFPWGTPNTPLARFKGPRKWQCEVLRDIKEHIAANEGRIDMKVLRSAVASGRGIGKSALVAWLILWMLTTCIGSTVIVSANSEAQLNSSTWGELSKWAAMLMNAHWWEISATRLEPAKWLTAIVERDLCKGTRYWRAEGRLWSEEKPDSYAGTHNSDGLMVIFDEASGIPATIWGIANGFFTENVLHRYWFSFSNPRRNEGYFFECFNSRRDFWKTRNIDARTVEGSDKEVYAQIIAEYGEDSAEAKVEVYGQFPEAGEDQFISRTVVEQAAVREQYKDDSAPIVIGIDPARGGLDSTVILVRRGRDIISLKRYSGEDTMAIVGYVIEAIETFKPTLTVIDEGGLGYGILDRLTEQRYKVRGVNFGWKSNNSKAWGNKRAEMWGAMRDWLKSASIGNDRQLKADLVGPHKKPDSSGTIYLEGKKEMKSRGLASPDAADALAVTFAFPVANRENTFKPTRRPTERGAALTSWMGC